MKPCLASFVLLALLATGCQTPTQTVLAQLAVQRATYEVIKDDVGRADRVVAIARSIEELAGGEGAAAVPVLMAIVKGKIDWTKLSPPDVQLVNTLLDLLAAELQHQFDKLPVDADKWIKVKTLATWVRETAELYDSVP